MNWIEIITQVSLLVGIWAAIASISAWRREHIGKRQVELAEDTLALFYEAVDAIKHIRHLVNYPNELNAIEKLPDETDEEFDARRKANVIFYRYNQHQELFSKIHASRYRFMAQIGKSESAPFDELNEIVKEINTASYALSKLWAGNPFPFDGRMESHEEKIIRYESVLGDVFNDDNPINLRIDEMIKEIEKTCQSVIFGKSSVRGFFSKKSKK